MISPNIKVRSRHRLEKVSKSVESLRRSSAFERNDNDNQEVAENEDINKIIFVPSFTIPESKAKFALLQEAFFTAKLRATELINIKVSLPLKLHSQHASKVYSSIATLLYAHLTMAKVQDIEKFIKFKASQLPQSVLNLNDWENVLNIANEYRQSECIPHSALTDLKHDIDLRLWLAIQAVKSTKKDIKEMRKLIHKYITDMNLEMSNYMQKISHTTDVFTKHITNEADLLRKQNNDLNSKYLSVKADKEQLLRDKDTLVGINIDNKAQITSLEMEMAQLKQNLDDVSNNLEIRSRTLTEEQIKSSNLETNLVQTLYQANELKSLNSKLTQETIDLNANVDNLSIKNAFYLNTIQNVMKSLESSHMNTLQSLPESLTFDKYQKLISVYHENDNESVLIPTTQDILDRCEIVMNGYNDYIHSIMQSKDKALSDLQAKYDQLNSEAIDSKNQMQLKYDQDTQSYQQQIDDLKIMNGHHEQHINDLASQLETKENQFNDLELTNSELNKQIGELRDQLEIKTSQLCQHEVVNNQSHEQINDLKNQIENQSNQILTLQDVNNQSNQQINDLNDQLRYKVNQINELNNKIDNILSNQVNLLEESKDKESKSLLLMNKYEALYNQSLNTIESLQSDLLQYRIDSKLIINKYETKASSLQNELMKINEYNLNLRSNQKETISNYNQTISSMINEKKQCQTIQNQLQSSYEEKLKQLNDQIVNLTNDMLKYKETESLLIHQYNQNIDNYQNQIKQLTDRINVANDDAKNDSLPQETSCTVGNEDTKTIHENQEQLQIQINQLKEEKLLLLSKENQYHQEYNENIKNLNTQINELLSNIKALQDNESNILLTHHQELNQLQNRINELNDKEYQHNINKESSNEILIYNEQVQTQSNADCVTGNVTADQDANANNDMNNHIVYTQELELKDSEIKLLKDELLKATIEIQRLKDIDHKPTIESNYEESISRHAIASSTVNTLIDVAIKSTVDHRPQTSSVTLNVAENPATTINSDRQLQRSDDSELHLIKEELSRIKQENEEYKLQLKELKELQLSSANQVAQSHQSDTMSHVIASTAVNTLIDVAMKSTLDYHPLNDSSSTRGSIVNDIQYDNITGPNRSSIIDSMKNSVMDRNQSVISSDSNINSDNDNQLADLSIELPDNIPHESVIALQSLIRGFLGRSHVKDLLLQKAAKEKGILVAYQGTKQGDSGWYAEDGSLFYFTLYQGEFLLICGPIDEGIYNLAKMEMKDISQEKPAYQPHQYPNDILINRFVLQTIRCYIDSLNNEIKDKSLQLEIAKDSIQLNQTNHEQTIQSIHQDYRNRISSLEKQIQSRVNDSIPSGISRHSSRSAAQGASLTNKPSQPTTPQSLTDQSGTKTPGPSSKHHCLPFAMNKPLETVPKSGSQNNMSIEDKSNSIATESKPVPQQAITIEQDKNVVEKVIKFQAATRGYLARQKMESERITKSAEESGVLVALRNTVQGESGWYNGPNGIYYFVQDNGEWILVAGPIHSELYDQIRRSLKSKIRHNSMLPFKSDQSFSSKSTSDEKVLMQCPFRLAFEHEDIKGDVYMSSKSERLFIGVSVDELILSSQLRSNGGGVDYNSSMESYAEESVSSL